MKVNRKLAIDFPGFMIRLFELYFYVKVSYSLYVIDTDEKAN